MLSIRNLISAESGKRLLIMVLFFSQPILAGAQTVGERVDQILYVDSAH